MCSIFSKHTYMLTQVSDASCLSTESLQEDFDAIQQELLCNGSIHLDVENQRKCSEEMIDEIVCIVSTDPTVPVLCVLEKSDRSVIRLLARYLLMQSMVRRFGL